MLEIVIPLFAAFLFLKPPTSVILAGKTVQRMVKAPRRGSVVIEGVTRTFIVEDFVVDGELVTHYAVAKISSSQGDVLVVLSKAEIELMQQASFVKAALRDGIPVGDGAMEKIAALISEHTDEVARSKSRQVQ